MKPALSLILLAGFFTGCMKYNPEITEADLQTSVGFLASDSLLGRATGSDQLQEAAAWISDRFSEAGLVPLGDSGSYFRSWPFVSGVEMKPSTAVVANGTALLRPADFQPAAFSGSASLRDLEVAFAGFGLDLPDGSYSEYGGEPVTGKAVVVFSGNPDKSNPHSLFASSSSSSVRVKARTADAKGAAALLVVNPFNPDNLSDQLPAPVYDRGAMVDIPVVYIKRSVVDSWLKTAGKPGLETLEKQITPSKPGKVISVPGVRLDVNVSAVLVKKPAVNVVGLIEGTDPVLKNEYVVIGAHYDHLGMGGQGSLYRGPEPQIHNGADDNASGTAGLIELIQAIAGGKNLPKRSIIAAAFSGEELGLLGSTALVDSFPVPLNQVVAMFNFDMIGRLDSLGQVVIYGTGTSPGFSSMLDSLNSGTGLVLTHKPEGYGPSDHSVFYSKGIPVLFFHTGLHSDYHRPTDDAETLNYQGMTNLLQLSLKTVLTFTFLQMEV